MDPKPKARKLGFFSKLKNKISHQPKEDGESISAAATVPNTSSQMKDSRRDAPQQEHVGSSTSKGSVETVNIQLTGASSAAAALSNPPLQVLDSIHDLWNEAYEELKETEQKLMTKYKARLRESMQQQVPAMRAERNEEELMKVVVEKKLGEFKDNTWKLKGLGGEVAVKDLAKPVVGVIKWADTWISSAVSANPIASIGWAGVSVFLPLLLNPAEQEASLMEGLESISNILVRSSMQENLYFRRWESNADKNDREGFFASHQGYRDTLKKLYILVLKFQATSVCYFTKNGALRTVSDMMKRDDWVALLADVNIQDTAMCLAYNHLNDTRIEEEFEKLEKRHTDQMELWKEISTGVSGIWTDMSALRKATEEIQNDKRRKDLLDWLSSTNPSEYYNKALEKHESNTGDWLLQSEDFEAWKTAANSLMWLNGKAGSGKSVLSSSAITHLEVLRKNDATVAVAYFYFSFGNTQVQNTTEMLASLIKQLCCCRPDTPEPVNDLHDTRTRGHRPDRTTLEKTLIACTHDFSSVYLVIDALDECPTVNSERRKLMQTIRSIHTTTTNNLHLLITSRPETDIAAVLTPLLYGPGNINVDLFEYAGVLANDISLYIDRSFASEQYVFWPEEVKNQARTALIEKSDGMFQYVSCQLDILQTLSGLDEIRSALEELPDGLDETYGRMLRSIEPRRQKQVANMLKWLISSMRPLEIKELAEIFILDPKSSVPFDEKKRLFSAETVLGYLHGLVTRFPAEFESYGGWSDWIPSEKIQFAHFSIKEYLVSTRLAPDLADTFSTSSMDAHQHIAESCIAYHTHLSKTVLATPESLTEFRLWEYVCKYWPEHLCLLDQTSAAESVNNQAMQIFTLQTWSFLNLMRITGRDFYWDHEHDWDLDQDQLPSPLCYAARVNSAKIAELIIKNGCDVDEVSELGWHGTALQEASYQGHYDMVQLLLDNNVNINAMGGKYGYALQAAVVHGHEDVSKLLLENGADVNAQGGRDGNPLHAAARKRDNYSLLLLLKHGADPNARGGKYGYALQAAAYKGDDRTIQLLLDAGADVNAKGGYFGNALQAAIASRHIDFAWQLFEQGAEMDVPGEAWEALLVRILDKRLGSNAVNDLCAAQEDLEGYFARWRAENDESLVLEEPSYGEGDGLNEDGADDDEKDGSFEYQGSDDHVSN